MIPQWRVLYGHRNHRYKNISWQVWQDMRRHIAEENCQIVLLTAGDNCRAALFGDPCIGVPKSLWIVTQDNRSWHVDGSEDVTLKLSSDGMILENVEIVNWNALNYKLRRTQHGLTLVHGRGQWHEELSEQRIALRFVRGHEHVLEVGGNIGRNSLLLARLLKTPHVVLESCPEIAQQLRSNRDDNGMRFDVVDAALSKRPLIQKDWISRVLREGEEMPADHFPVKTITWQELEERRGTWQPPWDTLVADCEGALLPILQDFPEMLDSMKLLLLENDYMELTQKQQLDELLLHRGFRCTYRQPGGWGPCMDRFYEVWLKPCE